MDTIPQSVIRFLEENPDWQWAGTISRAIHETTKHKESIIERRLREMYNKKLLEKSYEQVNGEGPKCVRYRLTPEKSPIIIQPIKNIEQLAII